MNNKNENKYITNDFTQYAKDLNIHIKKIFPTFSKNEFVLSQITKLSEEVGELSSEVLATVGYQRPEKLQNHSKETLEGEFADVLITSLLLAHACNIDVNHALEKKIEKLEKRYK
jgi:NTP pyrophosphatase (non-canonical NTP hydrolase)